MRTIAIRGASLVELGLVMVIISLALVPIVQTIGGPNSTSGTGNAVQVIGQKSKEILLANSLVEKALSGDYTPFNCGNPFNAGIGFPAAGQSSTFPAGSRCTSTNYNQPLYYQWIVRNMDATGSVMPTGNKYYTAVLNIWNTPTGGTPLLSLPTTFFWNESGMNTGSTRTGIAIVLDVSGSMAWGAVDGTPGITSLGSPYMKYRYRDPALAYVPSPADMELNLNDNSQLDITSFMDVNDPNTPWDDRYMKPGILGLHQPGEKGRPHDCSNEPAGVNSPWWSEAWAIPSNSYRNYVKNLCGVSNYGSPAWQATLNGNLSRIEAARSSLLSFLLSIEEDPDLYSTVSLGFVTFNNGVQTIVPLETANASNRYSQMRRKFSWINRAGPGNIGPGNSTHMYGGLERGAQVLNADPGLDTRIVFLVGDGAPTSGPTSHSSFRTLSDSLANGSFPGANGKPTTVFTLGLLSQDPNLPLYLRDSIAMRTPGGQFFYAQSIGDVSPIFNQIKYQIQRVILLNKSNRYNVNFM